MYSLNSSISEWCRKTAVFNWWYTYP